MPTIHWIGKDKVNHQQDVPFRLLDHQYGALADGIQTTEPTGNGNQIIHGGNINYKIKLLSEGYAYKQFRNSLDQDKVFTQPIYVFPAWIAPGNTSKDITESLYEQEGKINGFEEKVSNEIANLPNLTFWTRNPERGKGFRINGFLNHYPDFIIQTKSSKSQVVETKDDHFDAEKEIKLGATWAQKAGNAFCYFMVYEHRMVGRAYKLDDFLNILREIQYLNPFLHFR